VFNCCVVVEFMAAVEGMELPIEIKLKTQPPNSPDLDDSGGFYFWAIGSVKCAPGTTFMFT
jgi:hypothetical protein